MRWIRCIVISMCFVFASGCRDDSNKRISNSSIAGAWAAAEDCTPQFNAARLLLMDDGNAELSNLPRLDARSGGTQFLSGSGKWKIRRQLGKAVVDVYMVDSIGAVSSSVTLWKETVGEEKLSYTLGDPDSGAKIVLRRINSTGAGEKLSEE